MEFWASRAPETFAGQRGVKLEKSGGIHVHPQDDLAGRAQGLDAQAARAQGVITAPQSPFATQPISCSFVKRLELHMQIRSDKAA